MVIISGVPIFRIFTVYLFLKYLFMSFQKPKMAKRRIDKENCCWKILDFMLICITDFVNDRTNSENINTRNTGI